MNTNSGQPVPIIAVTSFKGGTAKTTTAIHFAAAMAGRLWPEKQAVKKPRKSVLLVDSDGTRSAIAYMKRGNGLLPFDVCDQTEAIQAMTKKSYEGFVIDTSANPDKDDVLSVARGASFTVVPITPDLMSLDAAISTLKLLREEGIPYAVLIARVTPNTHPADEIAASLEHQGVQVLKQKISDTSAYRWAAQNGTLVCDARTPSGSRHSLAGTAGAQYRAALTECIGLINSDSQPLSEAA